MNMSRNAADAPSSAPRNPTDEQRQRSRARQPPSPPPRYTTLPSNPHQNIRGASPSSIIASQHQSPSPFPPTVDHPRAAAHASDPDSGRRRRKHGAERSSPSASSSQGDMADTEMEMEGGSSKAGPASESAPEGPPPKKKRTRTLTTPHQAAVLHALLAQSRFPTTQMREEVGRSIGLSARKVQIWFQNQRQKARRPRGQASTTSAPLTRPPQFGPFTNAPPGSGSDVSPTAMTIHSASSAEGFFSRGPGSLGELAYGGSASSSAGSDRFAHAHRDSYLPQDYARSGMPPAQLAGPGIPGASRRPQLDDQPPPPWWPRLQAFSSRPSTAATETLETYRATPRPGRPAGEQGPELTLTLPPVLTNVPRARGAMSSPLSPLSASAYPSFASFSAMEAGASASRQPALPPPNVDFAAPRPPLNIPPPFTLQPQPQWDDPAFSPFTRRRSPPALPQGVAPPFESSPTSAHPPYSGEPFPTLAPFMSMTPSGAGLSPVRSPLRPPAPRIRFDPVRSTAGRAPPRPSRSARPAFYDPADEPSPAHR